MEDAQLIEAALDAGADAFDQLEVVLPALCGPGSGRGAPKGVRGRATGARAAALVSATGDGEAVLAPLACAATAAIGACGDSLGGCSDSVLFAASAARSRAAASMLAARRCAGVVLRPVTGSIVIAGA